jgi:hypothetical protein
MFVATVIFCSCPGFRDDRRFLRRLRRVEHAVRATHRGETL